jgi:hypothetical protein
MGLPSSVLATAQRVADALRATAEAKRRQAAGNTTLRKRVLVVNLQEVLHQVRDSRAIDDAALPAFLDRTQTDFINRMDAVTDGDSADSAFTGVNETTTTPDQSEFHPSTAGADRAEGSSEDESEPESEQMSSDKTETISLDDTDDGLSSD